MKQITAKFNSKCAETGKAIRKGETMLYNYSTKKCYCMTSKVAENESISNNDKSYVEAQENAYFDNFCYNNGI